MNKRAPMTRASRTARAVFGALAVTLFAAVSHGLAGGEITPIAVIATTVLALPLALLLSGKVGSLWRLSLVVVPAQFAYHWSFAGLGLTQSQAVNGSSATVASPHAHHLGAASFMPDLVAAGSADLMMWLSHGAAAVITLALIHSGERTALHLFRLLQRAMPVQLPRAVHLAEHRAILAYFKVAAPSVRQTFLSAMSHRGPPVVSALAN